MSKQFRVVIAGSRKFKDYELLTIELDYMLSKKIEEGYEIIIVSGGAYGADSLGERYAKEKGYKIERYPADWTKGKGAGYTRNCDMAKASNACVIFIINNSKGSRHMYNICKQYNVPVRLIECEEEVVDDN